jgi:hypothetical protein
VGTTEQSDYLSFLLRLWRVSGGVGSKRNPEGAVWRASLLDTLTEERVTFATIDDLFTFLRRQMGTTLDANQDETGV